MTAAPAHTPRGPTALTPAFPPDPSSTFRISTVLPFPEPSFCIILARPYTFSFLFSTGSFCQQRNVLCVSPTFERQFRLHPPLPAAPAAVQALHPQLSPPPCPNPAHPGHGGSSELRVSQREFSPEKRDNRASGDGQVQNILEGVHQGPRPSRFQKGSKSGGTRGKRKVMSRGQGTMAGAGRTAEGPPAPPS